MPHLFERYPGVAVVLIVVLSVTSALAVMSWYGEWSKANIAEETRVYCVGLAGAPGVRGPGRLRALTDSSLGCSAGEVQVCGYFLEGEAPETFVSDDCPG